MMNGSIRRTGWMVGLAAWASLGTTVASPDWEQVKFRLPRPAVFQIEVVPISAGTPPAPIEWLGARPTGGSSQAVELGSRVVVQLETPASLPELIAHRQLTLARTVTSNLFILQASDAPTAAREANRLAALPRVTISYPVMRRRANLHSAYAARPNDPYFYVQWPLEHRNTNGMVVGPDLNVRAAWPVTRGEGVTVAVVDSGVELNHVELIQRAEGAPHHNFSDGTTNAIPWGGTLSWAHGTEVAGLAVAEADNGQGLAGVAPAARLASWQILDPSGGLVSDELLMDAYQFSSNVVSVQNHGWGIPGAGQYGPSPLEQIGLSNALSFGRDGRGVVMLRSGGNSRADGNNANDNAYASDPRVIAVAAVGVRGRAATNSNPGACLLVAAPGGETGAGLFTTDLLGTHGANFLNYFPPNEHLSDYVFDALGFVGTSAASALISGVSALVLSANPALTIRDVQQIVLLSAWHFDSADPDLTRNGAGLLVSHNVGFGVPDAGEAVRLAQLWPNRPAPTTVTVTNSTVTEIPDDGLRVEVVGDGVAPGLASIRTLPGTGPHADEATLFLPLVDVGLATNAIGADLTGKAALIQRGTNNYADKINFAAQAGAAFAVVHNFATNTSGSGAPGGDQLVPMGGTDFTPIPAVFVSYSDGVALRALFATNTAARARIRLTNTNLLFTVTHSLLCEHVGLRLQTDHPLRGDLRITLVSPAGTRSVLQRYNADINPGPSDWTYYSTHHFFESSVGEWRLFVSDEGLDATGSVHFASLMLTGVPITDTDTDGLDDDWEIAHFGSLGLGPQDDPDGDGYSNAREQVMGTDPSKPDRAFVLDLSRWSDTVNRLSWPGVTNRNYEVWGTPDLNLPMNLLTNVPGQLPETEWFSPLTNSVPTFFRVRGEP